MLAGISGSIKKVKGALGRKFAPAAASALTAVGLMGAPAAVNATGLQSPNGSGELLIEAGKRTLPTIATDFRGSIEVFSSDRNIVTLPAPELYTPGSVFGTRIQNIAMAEQENTFIEQPLLISTGGTSSLSINESLGWGDFRADTTVLGKQFQTTSVSNVPTLSARSEISSNSYVVEYDPDTGFPNRFYSYSSAKMIVPSNQSITIVAEGAGNFQHNCSRGCSGSAGIIIGLGTPSDFNPEALSITGSSRDSMSFSDSKEISYTNSTDTNQTLYVRLVIASVSFPNSAATVNADGLGINNNVYRIAAAVPEPSTYALVGMGLLTVGFVAARRRREGNTSATTAPSFRESELGLAPSNTL